MNWGQRFVLAVVIVVFCRHLCTADCVCLLSLVDGFFFVVQSDILSAARFLAVIVFFVARAESQFGVFALKGLSVVMIFSVKDLQPLVESRVVVFAVLDHSHLRKLLVIYR